MLRLLIKDKHRRQRFAHIGAGVVILIHAYDKWESHHGSPLFFLISGLIFLTIALLHPLLEKKYPWIDGVFFAIEGILSLTVVYDGLHAGKKALPLAYALLAMMQFFQAFRRSRKGVQEHRTTH